jgi:O-antigen/teichoic acid export membrane protein
LNLKAPLRPFDQSGNFQKTPQEVSRLAVRGAGATLLSSGSGLVIQIGSTLILARLLLPSDFGLVAMVTTFSLFALNFGLNGFIEAILQADEINDQIASNLFWLNLGSGVLLTLGLAAAGSSLARFYSDPRVMRVAVGVSLSIFLTSSSVVHLALLNRAMRFAAISANDVIARIASTVISVALAWLGWGYWALVAGVVVLPLSTTVGVWSLCRWLPSRPRRTAGTRSIINFAVHTYGRFSLNYLTRNVDNLLVGWRFGALSLGYYKKAYDLFATPVSQSGGPVAHVALAGLSRFKNDPTKYRQKLLRAISILAFAGMGIGVGLTLVGTDLIRVVLGTKWAPAGPIFTYFGPGIGIMLLYNSHFWIHYSIGRADRALRWGFVEVITTVLLFIAGLHWGAVGVAAAWTLSSWILTVPAFSYAGQPIGLKGRAIIQTVWKYVVASLAAGAATALITAQLHMLATLEGVHGALIRLAVKLLLVGSLYLAGVILLHGSLTPVANFTRLIKQMLPFAKQSSSSEANDDCGVTEIPAMALTNEAN